MIAFIQLIRRTQMGCCGQCGGEDHEAKKEVEQEQAEQKTESAEEE